MPRHREGESPILRGIPAKSRGRENGEESPKRKPEKKSSQNTLLSLTPTPYTRLRENITPTLERKEDPRKRVLGKGTGQKEGQKKNPSSSS